MLKDVEYQAQITKGIYTISVSMLNHLGEADRYSLDIIVFEPKSENFLIDPNGDTQWHDDDLGLDFSAHIEDIGTNQSINMENLNITFSINEDIFLFYIQDTTDPNCKIILIGELYEFSNIKNNYLKTGDTIIKWENPETGEQISFNKGSGNLSVNMSKDFTSDYYFETVNQANSNVINQQLSLADKGYEFVEVVDGCKLLNYYWAGLIPSFVFPFFTKSPFGIIKWALEGINKFSLPTGKPFDPLGRYEVWKKTILPVWGSDYPPEYPKPSYIALYELIPTDFPKGEIVLKSEQKEIKFGEQFKLEYRIFFPDYCQCFGCSNGEVGNLLITILDLGGSYCDVSGQCDIGSFQHGLFHPCIMRESISTNEFKIYSRWTPGSFGEYDLTINAKIKEEYGGQFFSETTKVKVLEPVLQVNATPSVVFPGDTITLSIDNPDNLTIYRVEWISPEGNFFRYSDSAEYEVTCLLEPGNYNMSAKVVFKDDPCTKEINAKDTIIFVKKLIEEFSLNATKDEVKPGESIQIWIDDFIPEEAEDKIQSVNWEKTGGEFVDQINLWNTITWASPEDAESGQTYSITVNVEDECGNIISESITIGTSVIDFTLEASKESVDPDESIHIWIDNLTPENANEYIVSVNWEATGGDIDIQPLNWPNPEIIWSAPEDAPYWGNYIIKVNVEDESGKIISKKISISIKLGTWHLIVTDPAIPGYESHLDYTFCNDGSMCNGGIKRVGWNWYFSPLLPNTIIWKKTEPCSRYTWFGTLQGKTMQGEATTEWLCNDPTTTIRDFIADRLDDYIDTCCEN